MKKIILKTWRTPNWGDAINGELVRLISGIEPEVREGREILTEDNYLVVGSIIRFVDDYSIIWGAGVLDEETDFVDQLYFPTSDRKPKKVLAVRGPKTREYLLKCGVECPEVYGDPVLLFPKYYNPTIKKKYKLGIVSHWINQSKSIFHDWQAPKDVLKIYPHTESISDLYKFIDDILSCEKIASDSLHGLIVADAYGIPAIHIVFTDPMRFKFEDYFRSVGRPDEFIHIGKDINVKKLLKIPYHVPKIDTSKLSNVCPFENWINKSDTLEEVVAMKKAKGEPILLHVGSGDIYLGGWINCDLENQKADVILDCSKIPLSDNSVQAIYNSHLLEHWDYMKGQEVLKEWHRVLVPGGKLITETPDLFGLCQRFVRSNEQDRVDLYGLFFGCPWLEDWNIHKFLYSETQLRWTLENIGFKNIIRVTADSHFVPPEKTDVFLKLEAVKSGIYKISWSSSQKPIELEMLQEFFQRQDAKIKDVLEIGVYYGGSTLLWGKMVKPSGGKVIGLDSTRFEGKYIYEGNECEDVITFVQADSHLKETKDKIYELCGRVDMLFIDGDHTYEGVKDDYLSYFDLVKQGGWIVFHDILDTKIHREAGCYVSKLWMEIKDRYEHWEIIDPTDQSKMGIGVIRV